MSNNKTKMNHEFLLSEYEQMFTEKRHTDGRFMFLISLYFTIITISVSVFAVLYNLDGIHFENAMSVFAYVFLLVAVLGMIIVAAMCFNRVNNVKAPAKVEVRTQKQCEKRIAKLSRFGYITGAKLKRFIHPLIYRIISMWNVSNAIILKGN